MAAARSPAHRRQHRRTARIRPGYREQLHLQFSIKCLLTFADFNVRSLFGDQEHARTPRQFSCRMELVSQDLRPRWSLDRAVRRAEFFKQWRQDYRCGIRTVPDEFILRISPDGRIHQCRVIWRSKDGIGVKFTHASERKLEPENKTLATSE